LEPSLIATTDTRWNERSAMHRYSNHPWWSFGSRRNEHATKYRRRVHNFPGRCWCALRRVVNFL